MSYSFHLFDLNGAVAISRKLALKDDLDALDEAVRQSHAHAVEIWQQQRLVARVKLGNAGLNAGDGQSL